MLLPPRARWVCWRALRRDHRRMGRALAGETGTARPRCLVESLLRGAPVMDCGGGYTALRKADIATPGASEMMRFGKTTLAVVTSDLSQWRSKLGLAGEGNGGSSLAPDPRAARGPIGPRPAMPNRHSAPRPPRPPRS